MTERIKMTRIGKKIFKAGVFLALSFLSGMMIWGVWLAFHAFCVDSFIIPSESMSPTLVPGNRIYVNKLLMGARIYRDFHFDKNGVELKAFRTNGLENLQHNDITVFNVPDDGERIKFVINYVYCKRCIGLPGDSVSIVNGYYKNNNYKGVLGLLKNQRLLSQTPDSLIPPEAFHTLPYDKHLSNWTIKNFGPLYIPRKGDKITITPGIAVIYRKILEWEQKGKLHVDWQHRQVYINRRKIKYHTFQNDYYFMAGDNVLDSKDSRYWGFVPEMYIVGIVTANSLYSR